MITLDRLKLHGEIKGLARIALSDEEEQIAKKYKDLFFVEQKLLEAAVCGQSLDIPYVLGDLICRAIKVVAFEKIVLQLQWKELQTGDKHTN